MMLYFAKFLFTAFAQKLKVNNRSIKKRNDLSPIFWKYCIQCTLLKSWHFALHSSFVEANKSNATPMSLMGHKCADCVFLLCRVVPDMHRVIM